MDVDRLELHALLERIPDADLPVTRKLLQALAAGGDWDVAPAETEGEFTEHTLDDLKTAEVFFDGGGQGVPHQAVLKEFGLG